MALVKNICFVLLSIMVFIVAVTPRPEATIECTEHGFKPTITQSYRNDTETRFDVVLGDGSEGCNATRNVTGSGDGSEVVGVTQLNPSGNADEIPYSRNGGYACGGTFQNNAGNTSTVFSLSVEVFVKQVIRNVLIRENKYEYNLKCVGTKSVVTSQGKWTVGDLDRTGDVKEKNATFTLDTKLEFFKTGNYSDRHDTVFQLKAGDRLYVQIREANPNPLFKFVVNKCWSTPNSSATFHTKDVFFDKECPIDTTMTFTDPATSGDYYQFSIQAFFFLMGKELAIYVHCDLYICRSDEGGAMCTQPTKDVCDGRNGVRRRRSVDDEPIERVTVSSQQYILFDNSEIYAPTCAKGYVYDRISKDCTKQNVLQISGVYLDIDWNPLYANTSSEAFAEFAKVKAYQLYALVQASTTEGVIRGIKVTKAMKGSVILDVQVTYAETSNSQTAFKEFEIALQTTRVTASRVLDILNIKQRPLKSIGYVPVMTRTSKMNVTLIVVVVVFLVIVFIFGITFYKVKQLRRPPSNTKDVDGFDNRAMDNMS